MLTVLEVVGTSILLSPILVYVGMTFLQWAVDEDCHTPREAALKINSELREIFDFKCFIPWLKTKRLW